MNNELSITQPKQSYWWNCTLTLALFALWSWALAGVTAELPLKPAKHAELTGVSYQQDHSKRAGKNSLTVKSMSMQSIFSSPSTFSGTTTALLNKPVSFSIPANIKITSAQWRSRGISAGGIGAHTDSAQTGAGFANSQVIGVISNGTTWDTGYITATPAQVADMNAAVGGNLNANYHAVNLLVSSWTVSSFELRIVYNAKSGGGKKGSSQLIQGFRMARGNGMGCARVFEPAYGILTAITSMPRAYSIYFDDCADWLWFSPGRMFDGTLDTNSQIGYRIWQGNAPLKNGWIAPANYIEPSGKPQWCGVCDLPAPIPWGGHKVTGVIEFYSDANTYTAGQLEFSIVPMNDPRGI